MTQDEEHLRLLSIFHYIVAGLAALFAVFSGVFGLLGGSCFMPQRIRSKSKVNLRLRLWPGFSSDWAASSLRAARRWRRALLCLVDSSTAAVVTGSYLFSLVFSACFPVRYGPRRFHDHCPVAHFSQGNVWGKAKFSTHCLNRLTMRSSQCRPDLIMSLFAVQPSPAASRAPGGAAHLFLVR